MSRKPRVPIREARGAERYLDAEKMHQVYDSAGNSLAYGTIPERTLMAADVARGAVRLAKAGTPVRILDLTPDRDQLEAALRERLLRYVQAGHGQVAEELQRQRAERHGTALAETGKARQKAPASSAAATAVALKAVTCAGLVLSAMREAAARAVMARGGADLTAAELEPVLVAAGDTAVLRFAATVHDLVSFGRAEEAKANAGDIEDAVYSSILDGNCCEECAAMDGTTTMDLAEAETWTPNVSCAGLDRCRCVTVYQLRQ